MLAQLELFCHGFATVVESVLLLVMLDRVNRPVVALWMKWLAGGAWLWHAGNFAHVLLRPVSGILAAAFDDASMIMMAGGLLLMPCALLHGAVRLQLSGADPFPKFDRRLTAFYTPVLMLVPVAAVVIRSDTRDFMDAVNAFRIPYLLWLSMANLAAAVLFFRQYRRLQLPGGNHVLWQMAVCLVVATGLAILYSTLSKTSTAEPALRLLTAMSPLAPTFVFAWHIFRRRLLPLVLERTLVYGAIVFALLWLHAITIAPVARRIGGDLNLNLLLLEGILAVLLVLAWQPLRLRVGEALRYLVGRDVTRVRDATHHLSVELSRRATGDATDIASWFVSALQQALNVEYAWLCLAEPFPAMCGAPEAWLRNQVPDWLREQICGVTFQDEELWHERASCRQIDAAARLRELDAAAVFRIAFRDIQGWLLLGLPEGRDRISTEQLHALALLADQFAATLHNRHLEAARQTAERRAMQQEKLSVLGLMSGSLAHELKNPLSSMKTIATLLNEDLGPDHEHTRDVEMIVTEIDRLNEMARRLLDYSRPADDSAKPASPDRVIERLLHILRHFARQYGVQVVTELNTSETVVMASDATLSEIFFNLIKNAIEAAREGDRPRVTVRTFHEESAVVVEIVDNGPGVDHRLKDQIFEPFVTGKQDGTGLGLYLVRERVKELGGSIRCKDGSGQGTVLAMKSLVCWLFRDQVAMFNRDPWGALDWFAGITRSGIR
ncbi:MAG: ATP-binding protein [Planctomycetaceae bacterium]